MKSYSFSQNFLDYFNINIKSIQEPLYSSNGVKLTKLVFVPVDKEGCPLTSSYFYSPSYLMWVYRLREKLPIMDSSNFSHLIGVQVL